MIDDVDAVLLFVVSDENKRLRFRLAFESDGSNVNKVVFAAQNGLVVELGLFALFVQVVVESGRRRQRVDLLGQLGASVGRRDRLVHFRLHLAFPKGFRLLLLDQNRLAIDAACNYS